MSNRIEKINDLIRDNLSKILNKDLSLKSGVFVSIIKVDTSKDLRYCHVFISTYPEAERDYVRKTLRKETYRIQGALNKTLTMKILPRIDFRTDTVQEEVGKLEELFEQIEKEKR
jgi:ribosome-binding factor A